MRCTAGSPAVTSPLRICSSTIAPELSAIEENGVLLGFVEEATYPEAELRLDRNGRDRFLLYTDGLIEAANRRDDQFGIDGVERALALASGLTADGAADAILAAKDEWSGLPPADDLTLVLVDRARGFQA